jgi:hypothetical protein
LCGMGLAGCSGRCPLWRRFSSFHRNSAARHGNGGGLEPCSKLPSSTHAPDYPWRRLRCRVEFSGSTGAIKHIRSKMAMKGRF